MSDLNSLLAQLPSYAAAAAVEMENTKHSALKEHPNIGRLITLLKGTEQQRVPDAALLAIVYRANREIQHGKVLLPTVVDARRFLKEIVSLLELEQTEQNGYFKERGDYLIRFCVALSRAAFKYEEELNQETRPH